MRKKVDPRMAVFTITAGDIQVYAEDILQRKLTYPEMLMVVDDFNLDIGGAVTLAINRIFFDGKIKN